MGKERLATFQKIDGGFLQQRAAGAFIEGGSLRHPYLKAERALGSVKQALERKVEEATVSRDSVGETWRRLRGFAAAQASAVIGEVWGRESEFWLSTTLYLVEEFGKAYVGNEIPGSGGDDPDLEILGPDGGTVGQMRLSSVLLVFGAQAAAWRIACKSLGQESPWPADWDTIVGEHVARQIAREALF